MRYIGNKRKLLSEIEAILGDHGVRGGHLLDIFSGTATVARRFRALGFRVTANDRLASCQVLARAALAPERAPDDVPRLLEELADAPLREGLIARQYSPLGTAARRFFTGECALAIDAALERLAEWIASGRIDAATASLCLASVIDAADRVANISGTYGAFLKTWQPNALKGIELRVPEVPRGPAGTVLGEDANCIVGTIPCDVLYVDPPYNVREYAANYHVLEAIARRPFFDGPSLERFEVSIYGKSGLLPYERSAFSDRNLCLGAFRDLIARCRAQHVVVSYNEEGILTREEITHALEDGLGARAVELRCVGAKRFRSDRDGEGRRYRVLPGRARDEIHEWLFHAERPARCRGRRSRAEAPGQLALPAFE